MIDIETILFDKVARAVRTFDDAIACYGEYVDAPEAFPCMCMYEIDNRTYARSRTLGETENHAQVTYEINIYTARNDGGKQQAKLIADVVDDALSGCLFTRTFRGNTPNIDRNIYRITMRYTAVVSKPGYLGEDGYYTIYSE